MTGLNLNNVLNAIKIYEKNRLDFNNKIVNAYSNENVSEIIVKKILSYIDYINLNNYKKNIS